MHAACSHQPVAVPWHALDRTSPTRAGAARPSSSATFTRIHGSRTLSVRSSSRAEIAAFVEVPLIKEGQWVAMFGVHSATPRIWTRDQIELVEVTAERMWVADARARAEEALGRIGDRHAFLRKLNDTIRPLADPARILAETCRLLGTHLRVNRVAYGEIEGDYCTIVDDYVDGLPRRPAAFHGLNSAAAAPKTSSKAARCSSTTRRRSRIRRPSAKRCSAAGIGAYICPLLVKDGRFVGSFGIHSREPRVWTADEIALAQDVADRIWATLEHRKAEAELRANEERLEFLLRLNDALRPLSDPGEVQATAARLLAQHLGVTRVGYAEFDGGEYKILREYTQGVAPLAGHRRASP